MGKHDMVDTGNTPTDISPEEWLQRQANAIIPFAFDPWGWPVNPLYRTGNTERNLHQWGENQAADPLVFAGYGTNRHVLLIKRDDTGQWALPGGMVDRGEHPYTTLVRELREETNVDLADADPMLLTQAYAEDHRASDHAWVATTVGMWQLPTAAAATAGDDAADAAWWPADEMSGLYEALQQAGAELHEGHSMFIAMGMDEANLQECYDFGDPSDADDDTSVSNIAYSGSVIGAQTGHIDGRTIIVK